MTMTPTTRGPMVRGVRRMVALAAAGVALHSLRQLVAPSTEALSFVGNTMPTTSAARDDCMSVARQAEMQPAPEKYGSSRYDSYDGYVYRRKKVPHLRLRMERWGTGHWPFYRIKAHFQKTSVKKSGRFLETVGWWDPMRELDDPKALKLKLDRCVYWLRNGAQPTDQVASLLDRAGIIRRLGPLSKRGEWEWRVPKESGPEAPEGWSYDGPHEITWNNKPRVNRQRNTGSNAKRAANTPLIERYGFKGYTKVPVDFEDASMPVEGTSLLSSFDNTELPVM